MPLGFLIVVWVELVLLWLMLKKNNYCRFYQNQQHISSRCWAPSCRNWPQNCNHCGVSITTNFIDCIWLKQVLELSDGDNLWGIHQRPSTLNQNYDLNCINLEVIPQDWNNLADKLAAQGRRNPMKSLYYRDLISLDGWWNAPRVQAFIFDFYCFLLSCNFRFGCLFFSL